MRFLIESNRDVVLLCSVDNESRTQVEMACEIEPLRLFLKGRSVYS